MRRQQETKRDFIVDTRNISMLATLEGGRHNLVFPAGNVEETMPVRDTAHSHFSTKLGIPKKYYDRMRTNAPDLLSVNVNRWLNDPKDRMIRTLDGEVRAILGNRYKRRDNYDLLEQAVLPEIAASGLDLQVRSCNLSDRHFQLKVTTSEIQGEVKVGDIVESGFKIGNSEIGDANTTVVPFLRQLKCGNGWVVEVDGFGIKQVHSGRVISTKEENTELYSDATLELDDRAFFSKVRDIIRATLKQETFDIILAKLRKSAGIELERGPKETVELTAKRFDLSEGEGEGILSHLCQGGDLSLWGLASAVTRAAEDCESYDRATELEQLGGRLVQLPANDSILVARN